MDYHGCHMSLGSRKVNCMHDQWTENCFCPRSHPCLFVRSHSMTRMCFRMWTTYCIIHDVAVGLWDLKEYLDGVHGNCNHNLNRFCDGNTSRCYVFHGENDIFSLFLMVSFIEV